MKYKKGDKVRIIKKECGHEFDIGAIVTIEDVRGDLFSTPYRALGDDNLGWWLADPEIEPVFPIAHTNLGLSILKSHAEYCKDTCKQLEYQLSVYDEQYQKAVSEFEDYETKLNEG